MKTHNAQVLEYQPIASFLTKKQAIFDLIFPTHLGKGTKRMLFRKAKAGFFLKKSCLPDIEMHLSHECPLSRRTYIKYRSKITLITTDLKKNPHRVPCADQLLCLQQF